MRNEIFNTLKHVQWRIAKGHLGAFLATYTGQPSVDARYDDQNQQDFEVMDRLVKAFIEQVDEALALENP